EVWDGLEPGVHTLVLEGEAPDGSPRVVFEQFLVDEQPAPPSAPLDVTTSAGTGSVDVEWEPPSSHGGAPLVGYTAVAEPGGSTCDAVPPDTICTIDGLVDGSAYTVTVSARNTVGSGPPST